MALRCTVDPRGLQDNPHNIATGRSGTPPNPHFIQTCPASLRPPHSMCLTNHQPSSSCPPVLLPIHHHMARPIYRPPCSSIPNEPEKEFEFHPHVGPPPTTPRRLSLTPDAMVCPHLSMRDHAGLPRPLSLPLLPTKANFNPDQVFPVPPSRSDHDSLLFSDGSKSRGRVGAAFVHLHPATGSTIGFHLLPLPSYMSVFDAELYAASCALQYAANCMPRHDAEPPPAPPDDDQP